MFNFEKWLFSFVVFSSLSAILSIVVFSPVLNKDKWLTLAEEALVVFDLKSKAVLSQVEDIKVFEPVDWVEEGAVQVIDEGNPMNFKVWRPQVEVKDNLIKNKIDFLEINFPTGKIIKHKSGQSELKKDILAAGDPQGWGGTPAGLYNVLSKNEKSFSMSSSAYMPYAVHFYGKYFIHGEPYLTTGDKIDSVYSGGCIRVADKDVQNIFTASDVGLPVLVIDKNYIDRSFIVKDLPKPLVSAKSFAVVDLESGVVLADKEAQTKRPIASITKLMTAVVVAENIDLRKGVYATDNMLEAYGSTEGLTSGGFYKAVELFHLLLTESSNDAAEVLTGFLGREATINLMTEKAKSLFMADTSFADPSGFDRDNISTAKDLTFLARYIYNNRKPILDITAGRKVTTFGPMQFEVSNLVNKNSFKNGIGFIGGKTGFINDARNTGLFIFKMKNSLGEEFPVGVTVLGSESLKQDTEKLLEWVEEEYELERVG